jgi:hypothetical protein
LLLLVADEGRAAEVDELLAERLPASCLGLPTRFPLTRDPQVRHRVEVTTVGEFVRGRLGFVVGEPPTILDWLSATGQALAEITAGAVFADSTGDITKVRRLLAWYPDDIWLYVIAADWLRIAEELPLAARAGLRGDAAGSRVISARICGALMHLGFMLERSWPPYAKWLGTAFGSLPASAAASDDLSLAMSAQTWQERQEHIRRAVNTLYTVQRAAGLPSVDDALEPFHDRPFVTVSARTSEVIRAAIRDPAVRALPPGIGSIEQWVDNVAVLTSPHRRLAAVRALVPAR